MDNNLKTISTVVKSNALIEAGYRLSLQEQRAILLCITKINSKSEKIAEEYVLSVKEYAEHFSIPLSGAYSELKRAISSLYEKSIRVYDEETQGVLDFRWLSEKMYIDGQGIAKICFSQRVAPFLVDLKSKFTSYNLASISNFKSSYSIRIYEIVKQYESLKTRQVSLDWLRNRLQIQNSYKSYGSIKQKILEVAKDEINNLTEMNLDYTAVKTGKKVTHIIFTFSLKSSKTSGKVTKTNEVTLINFIKHLNPILDEFENGKLIDRDKLSFAYNKFKANGNTVDDFEKLITYITNNHLLISSSEDLETLVGQRLYLGYKKTSQKYNSVNNPLSQSYYHEHGTLNEAAINIVDANYEVID
ncbi:replication protein (plasmid) [Piscirickettsia salmonis]|nr:replication protein [Piscirickettsia salmonis]